ncbi:MAG TPA: hypothetical protein VGM39_18020 [Kofleriaceae bacterium]|jgi:hypothetical protein
MWRGRVAGVGLASFLLAGVAVAQPAEPVESYPSAYADRPLLLPNGAVEGSAALRIDTVKDGDNRSYFGSGSPSVRVGLGMAEIEAGASIYLFQHVHNSDSGGFSSIDPDRLQNLYAIGRFTVAPETAVALQFIATTPADDDYKSFVPGAFIEHKERFGHVSSLRLTGGLNYVRPVYGDDTIPVNASLDFYAKVRAAVQIAPMLALEAATELHYVKITGDMPVYDSYTSSLYSVGIVGTVAPDFDLVAAFESNANALGGQTDGKAFIVGIVGRRIP